MTTKKKDIPIKIDEPIKQHVVKKSNNALLVWGCMAAIAIITYFIFSPSMQNGFTNWDDNFYVTDNPLVKTDTIQMAKIFETPVALNYHPLTILSLALNYQTGKLDPTGYHLENVIVHVLNTILVFLFVFLLTRRNLLMAAIVSLFFGIHPMHVESVTWVSERKDVLYVFFFMLGLITYLRYSETKKWSWYVATFLLFILSCLSKGMAVVFPVILVLVDYLRSVKWTRRLVIEKAPFFILATVFGIIAVKIQSTVAITSTNVITIFQRVILGSYGCLMYIVKLFVPYKLSAFYPYPVTNFNDSFPLIFYLSPLILLAVIGIIIYAFIKKEKEIVFGMSFYLVAVVFVLQFISVGRVIIADRYSYLSYIGLVFVIAYFISKAFKSKNRTWAFLKYPFISIVAIGAVVFSYQTYARTQVWQNDDVLWTNVINNYPTAYMAYYNRGGYYFGINKMDSALEDFMSDLQINPIDDKAYYYCGMIYGRYGRNRAAITCYTRSMILNPSFASTYFNRSILYANEGKNDSALADLNTTINLEPGFPSAYTNRGVIYYKYSSNDLALKDFTAAIELDPKIADAYNDRGALYLQLGKKDLAIADYNSAVANDPASGPCYYNRALFFKANNQYAEAITDFSKGIQLNPQNIFLYYNSRGLCYIATDKYDEAIADFSEAIELNSSIADFWLNRSLAEDKIGEKENAKADAAKAKQLQKK